MSESYITTDGQSAGLSVLEESTHPGLTTRYLVLLTVTVLFYVGRLLWRDDGSVFLYAAGPCQRSLSLVRVPWNLRPYITVSDLRLPFSSPPTTRRVAVEVFAPASTRASLQLTRLVTALLGNWLLNTSRPNTRKAQVGVRRFLCGRRRDRC
jgi:hypothetical protein